jgi:hypothetical protein
VSLVHLSSTQALPERPFTNLRFTAQEVQAIRFMTSLIWLALENYDLFPQKSGSLIIHQPTPARWIHRIVVTQPERLRYHAPLTVVGFFGIKSRKANVPLAQKLDRQLIPELSNYDELLAYATVCLPTGDFGNLVLFASEAGKEEWGQSTATPRRCGC